MTSMTSITPRVRETDMTLVEALERLRYEQSRKVDIVVPEGNMMAVAVVDSVDDEPAIVSMFEFAPNVPEIGGMVLDLQDTANRQIAEKLGIPLPYYRRMMDEAPELWAENVNRWLQNVPRFVRAFRDNGEDGAVRAFLSDQFKVLDNTPFLEAVIGAAEKLTTEITVVAAQVEEDRIYLKLTTPFTAETKRGDVIRQGLTVSNSEVGAGALKIQPWALYLACVNGMTSTKNYRKVHLGGELPVGILTEETIRIRAEAVWAEVGDFTTAALGTEHLDKFVTQLDGSEEVEVNVEPRIAVANVVKTFGLSGGQGNRILERYLRDSGANGETQFGIVQAVTYEAHESETFREQVELEDLGGKLLEASGGDFLRMLHKPVTDKEMERAFSNRIAA